MNNPQRILILEDDEERHKQFLQKFDGHAITITETAHGAIELLQDQEWDILFLDHDLGGTYLAESGPGTGYEVATWLAENPERQPYQIIIHSANPPGAQRIKGALPKATLAPFIWSR